MTRILVAVALLAMSLVFVAQAQPAAAIPSIALNKSASGEVLVGESIDYSLTASNPTSNPDAVTEYNVSFRDVLPVGVTYDGGSTSPASYGEPTIVTDAGTGQQTLLWQNVADMSPGSVVTLSFTATVSAVQNPAGSSVTNNANVYANSNPRFSPRFNAAGVVIPTSYTQSASAAASTLVTALKIQKSEPSPEGELLRGVHDHTTVYTLQVSNNAQAPTNNTIVTDLIPAGLEFLGCGGVDNSSAPEYPGAASLTATPAVANCPTPQTVSTVVNPAGYPAGTYTQVVWNLGNLPVDAERTIRYAAGIPQRANTATWPGATPTPASLQQAANLNNNTGPSTREGATEQSLTNRARAEGDYTGPVVPGGNTHVVANDTQTVTAEDVSMQKSVTPNAFVQGNVARYTFTINTSEYVDASNIVITDHLPNGLCPLDDVANYTTGPPAIGNADCAPGAGFAPSGATFDNVQQNADGTFDITFSPIDVDANGVVQVSFSARMRTAYTGGANIGLPTSANDEFTNDVELDATTNPAPGVNPPAPAGPVTVHDDSSVTITSTGPSIQKSILPNVTPMNCNVAGYTATPNIPDVRFAEGDRVCFQVRINFPTNVSTRNPIVTDFLPAGVTYEPGSAIETPNNNVPVAFDDSGDVPIWRLGVTELGGIYRFVQPGGVFEARFSAIVSQPAAGPGPDITANLMKFRYSLTGGGTVSLRDAVDLAITAPPPVAILKGVADVDGVPAGGNPPNVDGVQVEANDVVTFRVDVTNNGSVATVNNLPIAAPEVWDALPTGIRCVDISAISDGGVCTNPGDAGQPTFANNATLSAIRWDLPAGYTINPGQTRTLTYDMTIPATTGVTTVFTNSAAVRSYNTATNLGGASTVEHLPQNNIDTTTDPAQWDVPAARDNSNVFTATPTLAKSNVTSITESGNTVAQAVVGELVTYTVQARVPANISVFNGVLTDPMPTGVTFVSSSAGFSGTNTSPATGALPAGVTFNSANGTLNLGQTYTNNSNNPHLFEVTIVGRVNTVATNTNGVVRTNTAAFNSQTAPTGGIAHPVVNATSNFTVVEPSPSIAKNDDDADNFVVAGQTITYSLTVNNATGRPPLHDSWVVDCVPSGINFVAFVPGFVGTATAVPGGGNGCAAGTTRIAWNPGSVLNPGTTLQYTATISAASAGGVTYTNTATLTGGTLNDGKTDPLAPDNPNERTYTRTASDTMTVTGAAITKTANPTARTIGERGSWTVTATIPASVNFYDAAIIDQLPQGIDPASLTTTSIACTYPGGAACALPGGGTPLSSAAGPAGSTLVGWLLGDLGSDAQVRTITLVYSATVITTIPSVDRGDVLQNSARVKWNNTSGPDPTSAGAAFDRQSNPATSNVTVIEPLLAIDKTVNDTTPAPGQTFTYSVVVSNSSAANTSAAYNVQVVDTVPTGVVVTAGSISNGGVLTGAGPNGGGTITWNLTGNIPVGGNRTLTYDAVLAASGTLTTAPRTNTADITRYTSLPVIADGRTYDGPTDTATVTPDFPHISVAKAVNGALAYIGEPKAWTITVTSDGASQAYGVDVTDTLPLNWSYNAGSATVSIAGGPAAPLAPTLGTSGGRQTLTWTDIGNLPVGQTIVINYTSTPSNAVVTNPGVGSAIPHSNSAAISASDSTGATGNASGSYAGPPASATARIDSADVTINKSHTGAPVAGRNFSWSVVVTNNGADVARGPFTVTDDLPAGITSPVASGPGWSCSTGAGSITCTRTNAADTLASGASFAPITVTVGVPADTPDGTVLTNAADVTAHTYDPNPGNNDDTDDATVVVSVDLQLTKTLNGDVVPGQDATYTLTVQNNGPSDSTAPIVVTDDLPAGSSFVSADGPGWNCGNAAGTVTCTRAAPLANGQVAPAITVVVSIPASQQGAVVNEARVDGPDPDPVPGNNDDSVTTDPEASADLAIAKSSTNTFVPGASGTYRFEVHNFGPSFADPDVEIVDTLPAELTYTGFTSIDGTWTCSAAGQLVTCILDGRLADGADATVDITVDIDPDHTGNTHNEATVSSPTPDPNESNNTDADDTTNTVESDLAINKSHTGPVVAGTDVTYTLAVRNNGASSSSGPVVVTDELPDALTYVSATGAGWVCAADEQLVTCTRAAGLGAGVDAPDITLVATVASGAGPTVIINPASVTGPETDTDPSNNTDHDPTIIIDRANITLTKTTVGDNPVAAGANTSFEVTVSNEGPSDADSIAVVDTLPAGMTLVSASGDGWDCGAVAPVTCTRDSIVAGTDAPVITVVVQVGSGVADGTTLTNEATVSTSTQGDDPDDNTDTSDVDVVTSADLSIVKTHQGGDIVAGTTVTFELAVHNDGPSDAEAPITVTDQLPAGMTFASSGGDWTCTPGVADAGGQEVDCELNAGGLLAGADAPLLTIVAQIDASVDPGTLTNTATVESPTDDPTPGNNTDTDDVNVTDEADVSIVKSHAGEAHVGDPLEFTLAVANAGPSEARNVEVTDTLPTGLEFVSGTGTDWTCSAVAQDVTCELAGPLGPNSSAEPITLIVNVLSAAFPGVDNTWTDPVAVPALVDLSIVKSHQGTFKVGREATYRLVVENLGPTADPGPVTVTDVLPEGLSYVSATGDGWVCTASGQTVTCEDSDGLDVDERTVIRLSVMVEAAAYPSVVNVASVTSPAEDTDPSNNTSSDPADVSPRVNLNIDKELLSMTQERSRWRVTVGNEGPNDTVSDVVVVDQLPRGLTYVSAKGPGWDCVDAGQNVTCTHPGVIKVDDTSSFTLTTDVKAPAGTKLTNVATVVAGDTDGRQPTDRASGRVPDGSVSPGDGGNGPGGDNGGLPGTGGVWLGLIVLGLLLTMTGVFAVRAGRRT